MSEKQIEESFIQVSMRMPGGYNLLSKKEFSKISQEKRTELILKGDIQFLIDGIPIPLREGLNNAN